MSVEMRTADKGWQFTYPWDKG